MRDKLFSYIELMRPIQWVKNGFVFSGFLFSNEEEPPNLLFKVIITAIAFCLISSCAYIINDIFDIQSDRKHPKKKMRPLASGRVSPQEAMVIALLLGGAGFLLGLQASLAVTLILILYMIINLLYDIWLKHLVLIDVFCISAGFMLRILAGTYGVDIPPSRWLLFCGLMVTLFFGFAKRRAELVSYKQHSHNTRVVLQNYKPLFLDSLISICAAATIISYSLYTMSEQTIHIHGTNNLIYTVPFVIYAVFRYIYLLDYQQYGEDPTGELLKDRQILASVAGWSISTVYLLNFP